MIDKFEPTVRRELSFEELVDIALSGSGIGDTSNNFNGVRFSLSLPEHWAEIEPPKTYEGYIKAKYERRPDLAAVILEKSDKSFVAQYDLAMEKINQIIGLGVTNEEQSEKVRAACLEAQKVVKDFCKTLPGAVKG